MNRLGAILLAAGGSRRFGDRNKLLEMVEGVPLVARAAGTLASLGLAEIVVVTGHERERVEHALARADVGFVHNARWEAGMGSSIAAGIGALSPAVTGAFVVPADMPFLSGGLIKSLAARFAECKGERIVFPATPAGEQRNPVLWPRRFFAELAQLTGEPGGKSVLAAHKDKAERVVFDDTRAFQDIDTPGDLTSR
jgi:molybdenum cofactor cytidylyltransferase